MDTTRFPEWTAFNCLRLQLDGNQFSKADQAGLKILKQVLEIANFEERIPDFIAIKRHPLNFSIPDNFDNPEPRTPEQISTPNLQHGKPDNKKPSADNPYNSPISSTNCLITNSPDRF